MKTTERGLDTVIGWWKVTSGVLERIGLGAEISISINDLGTKSVCVEKS